MSQQPSRAPEPVGAYPYTRRVGNLLFLSGVGPRQRGQKAIPGVVLNEDGQIISYDFESQCRAVFANVGYILEEAGARGVSTFTSFTVPVFSTTKLTLTVP